MSEDGASRPLRSAAFFDVDGTLTGTTIVHHYVYFRRQAMSALWGRIWFAAYLLKCVGYLILDRIDRSMLNRVFYRSYAGMPVADIRSKAEACYKAVIQPRQFGEAAGCLAEQRGAGRAIVLVTGSIDFIIAPLAKDLGADGMIAPSLVESNGRFTGELDGPPIGGIEKARRMRSYADAHGINLAESHAFADSIADLPMLECVGHPHAVNPDRALGAIARERGWPVLRWSLGSAAR